MLMTRLTIRCSLLTQIVTWMQLEPPMFHSAKQVVETSFLIIPLEMTTLRKILKTKNSFKEFFRTYYNTLLIVMQNRFSSTHIFTIKTI